MKQIKIVLALLVFICMSTQLKANNIHLASNYSVENKSTTFKQDNKPFEAFLQQSNGLLKGVVYINNGNVSGVYFPGFENYKLNIAPTAIKPMDSVGRLPQVRTNKFTHYVDTPEGRRVYFKLN